MRWALEMLFCACKLPRMKKLFPFLFLSLAVAIQAETNSASSPASQGLLRQMNDSFASVFSKAAPSVVVIEARSPKSGGMNGLPTGLEFYFRGPNGMPYKVIPEDREELDDMAPSIGSGFIFRKDGHILTNHHVIANAVDVKVKLQDGRFFPAEIIGADERGDLAVLKINAPDLPVSELGDSDVLKVGEFAFAIGTPLELPYTFTFGVISAKGRTLGLGGRYDEYIQTDTSINPGNSGGPLCDIDGKVIGINTLISGNSRGVGFAIPINNAKNVVDQLLAKGYVSRPWLGISIASLEEMKQWKSMIPGVSSGVVVRGIEPGAPAQTSDLLPGDVITKVDGKAVSVASDLQREVLGKKIGQSLELEVWRKGRSLQLMVKTGEQPDKFIKASMRPSPMNPNPHKKVPVDSGSPGMVVEDLTPDILKQFRSQRRDLNGVVVSAVEPFSAAAGAGLEPGDIITEAGGRPVLNKKDLESALASLDHDRGVLLMIERAGQKTFAILKP